MLARAVEIQRVLVSVYVWCGWMDGGCGRRRKESTFIHGASDSDASIEPGSQVALPSIDANSTVNPAPVNS